MTTAELEQHHWALVDMIGQAHDWARRFTVRTDYTGEDGETLRLYPLREHCEVLAAIYGQLGGSTPARASGVTILEGLVLVLGLQPSSPYYATRQDGWRLAVDRARALAATPVSVEELDVYRRGAQALFDNAFTAVRTAYADCAAATFGRHWARGVSRGDTSALVSWVKALADAGFSVEECESVLRLVEDTDPDSAATCRARRDIWLYPHMLN